LQMLTISRELLVRRVTRELVTSNRAVSMATLCMHSERAPCVEKQEVRQNVPPKKDL